MKSADRRLYEGHIVSDPAILSGKPVVRGTRVSVEMVLRYLAEDLDVAAILAAFPRLTREDVQACVAYAETVIEGEDAFVAAPGDGKPA